MENKDKRIAELEREKKELDNSLEIVKWNNARLTDENIKLKHDLEVRDAEAKDLKNKICGYECMQGDLAKKYGEMKASNDEKDRIIREKEIENQNLKFEREIGTVVAHAEQINIYHSKDNDEEHKF